MKPVLEVRDVSFAYRVAEQDVPVLRHIQLKVERGEFIAIQGSSGSGKSTLLYILGFLLQPNEGEILLNGTPLSSLSSEQCAYLRNRSIGFVFQQFHLLPRATVLENILLPTLYPCEVTQDSGEKQLGLHDKAKKIAESLGLTDHLHHRPNQLSGGQQQRVAIARALMNDVELILADEPTGNLDSKNAAQTLDILKELNRLGKTIVVITHDSEIAKQAQKIYHIRDGAFTTVEILQPQLPRVEAEQRAALPSSFFRTPAAVVRSVYALFPMSWDNLIRNKSRSLLTMMGITIGIAAVLAMITLGEFTRRKILDSYEALGVNKVTLSGWPNWKLNATDKVDVKFMSFDWEKDIGPLRDIFPQIRLASPSMQIRGGITANFNGNQLNNDLNLMGVNEQYATITNRKILVGRFIDRFQVENHDSVCVLGSEVAKRLFIGTSPINQLVYLTTGAPDPYTCLVIGVLKAQKTNSEWNKPNYQILIPYTLLPSMTDSWWDSQIHTVGMQLSPGSDVEKTAKSLKALFQQKYGRSGRFDIDSDAVLLAQMKRFLNLFTILLASIAFISLFVGGIGITNMMLVSVSERFKEIGLRKALGATDLSVRIQLLLEAVLLCAIAGLIGIVLGFSLYELLIYGASKFVTQLHFEWVINFQALTISVISVIAVGVLSGLMPAVKAEKLQVIEALRSE